MRNIKGKINVELILSIIFQFFAFILMKYAALETKFLKYVMYIICLGFLGLQALFWQKVLSKEKLSKVYFWYSISSFIFLNFANIYFREKISIYNVSGILIIALGFFIISKEK